MKIICERIKRPVERLRMGLNFTHDLDPGDPGASMTAVANDGTSDVSASVLESPALLNSGTVATVILKAGSSGSTITITFKVTTVAGLVFEHDLVVTILDGA